MDYRDIYKNWLASGALTADEKAELSAISDDLNAQKDRFGAELEFGTAGMRGVLGAGINRMNVYTVARATKGLARYIIGRGEDAMRRGVVVSYDTRRFSTEFAIVSAEVLNSFGIRVYLFENVRPVPVCSFAIRNLNAVAGIMITASHNPKIYNGYKVYGEDGAQMSPEDTAVVVKFIEEEKDYFAPYKKIGITESDIRNADGKTYENITVIGKSLDERYFAAIEKLMLSEDAVKAQRDKMNPVRNGRPIEHPLHRQLRVAVAVCRVRRVGFEDGDAFRLAVSRRSRGKDDVLHAVLDHALEHCPCTAEVVVVVLERIDHALTDLRIGREVDDRVNFLGREHMIAELFVADIALIKPRLRMDGLAEACLQIVRHDHIITVVKEFISRVAADVARAA